MKLFTLCLRIAKNCRSKHDNGDCYFLFHKGKGFIDGVNALIDCDNGRNASFPSRKDQNKEARLMTFVVVHAL